MASKNPENPSRRRIVFADKRIDVPAALAPWLGDPAEGLQTAHLFPLCWWRRDRIPELHRFGVWLLADLHENAASPTFDDWETPPDIVWAGSDAGIELQLMRRLIYQVDFHPRLPQRGQQLWRLRLPDDLLEAGCLPKHPDHVILAPIHASALTIWRPSAWKACEPLWPTVDLDE